MSNESPVREPVGVTLAIVLITVGGVLYVWAPSRWGLRSWAGRSDGCVAGALYAYDDAERRGAGTAALVAILVSRDDTFKAMVLRRARIVVRWRVVGARRDQDYPGVALYSGDFRVHGGGSRLARGDRDSRIACVCVAWAGRF